MKYLLPPIVMDVANLRALSERSDLSSHPDLRNHFRQMVRSYGAYRVAKGNALSPASPSQLSLSNNLKIALKEHYTREHVPLNSFIPKFRDEISPEVCPMCGSSGTGTLDHLYPQAQFPEFAFYSRNLVPACLCNSRRGNTLKGPLAGQRILHPFYDTFLNQPLVRAMLAPSAEHGIEKPIFDLEIIPPNTDPHYPAIKYHVDTVVRRTQIFEVFEKRWNKYCTQPERHFNPPAGIVTSAMMVLAINEVRQKQDDDLDTPNNWRSMLLAGIAVNVAACVFLTQKVNDLRRRGLKSENLYPA